MDKEKKVLIKTHITEAIAARLEAEATRKGLTLLEYVRWVLGDHATNLPNPETKAKGKKTGG